MNAHFPITGTATTATEPYYGMSNRTTWSVNRLIEASPELDRARSAFWPHMKASYWDGDDVERFVRSVWTDGITPDGHMLYEANWDELAFWWNED